MKKEEYSPQFRLTYPPQVVRIGGIPTCVYEIHFYGNKADSILIKSLTIHDASDSSIIVVLRDEELNKRIVYLPPTESGTVREVDRRGSIYIEVPLLGADSAVTSLLHELDIETNRKGIKRPFKIWGGSVAISPVRPVTLASPFFDGTWAAVYEAVWERGHRRVFYGERDRPTLPGRFAIDFIKIDEGGKYAISNQDSIKNWYSYGIPVLAVADGVVSSLRTDFKESMTLSAHPAYPSVDATGNYLSIKIANDQYVFYEHVKPGSIRVKKGDVVHKGDTLASIGFTGQTTGPHLHLHVADKDSALAGEGIPFVFDRFIQLGSFKNFQDFGKRRWSGEPAGQSTTIVYERPVPNAVIRFR